MVAGRMNVKIRKKQSESLLLHRLTTFRAAIFGIDRHAEKRGASPLGCRNPCCAAGSQVRHQAANHHADPRSLKAKTVDHSPARVRVAALTVSHRPKATARPDFIDDCFQYKRSRRTNNLKILARSMPKRHLGKTAIRRFSMPSAYSRMHVWTTASEVARHGA
jgi:hypothetical protein